MELSARIATTDLTPVGRRVLADDAAQAGALERPQPRRGLPGEPARGRQPGSGAVSRSTRRTRRQLAASFESPVRAGRLCLKVCQSPSRSRGRIPEALAYGSGLLHDLPAGGVIQDRRLGQLDEARSRIEALL